MTRCRAICSLVALVLTVSILPSGLTASTAAITAETTAIATVLPGGAGDGGPARDALVNAAALERDDDGNLWFFDRISRTIRRIDPDGVVTSVWGNGKPILASALGSAPDARTIPMVAGRIWSTTSGDLYLLAEDVLSRIRSDGSFEVLYSSTSNQFGPYRSYRDYDVPIFVRRNGSVLLARYRDAGNEVTTRSVVQLPPGEPRSTNATTLIPNGIGVIDETADGTLFFTDGEGGSTTNTIRRLNPDGSSTVVAGPGPQPAAPRPEGTAATEINVPLNSFAVSRDGTRIVYSVRPSSGQVALRTFEIGGTVTTIGGPTGETSDDVLCAQPSMAVGADGVLAACSGSIRTYDYDGSAKPNGRLTYGVNPRTGFGNSRDGVPVSRAFVRAINQVAVDPRDDALVIATADDIRKVNGDGADATLDRVAGGGAPTDGLGDGGPARDAVAQAASLAFAADGRL